MATKPKKADPFKTRKSKNVPSKQPDTITPDEDIAAAIDEFREFQEQAKHFEGEATIHKNKILEYCQDQFSQRITNGTPGSFKVLGEETMVTYVIQDSSAGLTEEDMAEFANQWGEDAADDLVEKDFRSIRFDEKVLSSHYDEVVKALQSLPDEILDNLFKPMLMKTKSNFFEKAKKYAKTPEEIRELMRQLKVKNYIR